MLLSRKEPIAGCTVAAAVKHLLPKKSTRVKLCAFKEIEIALIFFFCQVSSELKLHITDEAHDMSFAVYCIKTVQQIQKSFVILSVI